MNALKTLPGCGWVNGVTCLDDKLFALYQRNDNQLEVYSTRTSEDFKRLDLFTVEGLAGHDWHRHNDMTSSPHDKCLYISDHVLSAVHRSALDGKLIRSLAVPKSPCGLSLTSNDTLLIMCYDKSPESTVSRKLVELCGESGTYIRQVELQSDTEHPYHAVELYGDGPTQQCVIAHSYNNDSQSKVAVVDRADGNVLQSCDVSTAETSLTFVRHVAVDRHNFVFAADEHGDVVVISPSLQFVRSVKLDKATRLNLDHATRRRYVGHLHGVTVLQL